MREQGEERSHRDSPGEPAHIFATGVHPDLERKDLFHAALFSVWFSSELKPAIG